MLGRADPGLEGKETLVLRKRFVEGFQVKGEEKLVDEQHFAGKIVGEIA